MSKYKKLMGEKMTKIDLMKCVKIGNFDEEDAKLVKEIIEDLITFRKEMNIVNERKFLIINDTDVYNAVFFLTLLLWRYDYLKREEYLKYIDIEHRGGGNPDIK